MTVGIMMLERCVRDDEVLVVRELGCRARVRRDGASYSLELLKDEKSLPQMQCGDSSDESTPQVFPLFFDKAQESLMLGTDKGLVAVTLKDGYV